MASGITLPNERFAALMALADFWEKRRQARQKFELAFSLALWAAMAGAIQAFEKRPPEYQLALLLACLFVSYFVFWIRPIWQRAEHNTRLSVYYQALAERALNPSDAEEPPKPGELPKALFGCLRDWSSRVQLAITLALMIGVFLLLGQKAAESLCALSIF